MPATLGNLEGALSEFIGSTEAPSARQRVAKVDVPCKYARQVQNGCDLGDNDPLSSGGIDHFKKVFYRQMKYQSRLLAMKGGDVWLFGGGCRVVRRLMRDYYFRIVSCGLRTE